tara:strand:- start:1361 stop:1888 length:528 start_codon:yes stop_codon:yes gene_type:complete
MFNSITMAQCQQMFVEKLTESERMSKYRVGFDNDNNHDNNHTNNHTNILENPHVLIIESNNTVFQFYKIVFNKIGYKVTRGLNEKEGLTLAKKDKYKMILYEKYPINKINNIDEIDLVTQLRQWEKEQNITTPQVVFCASEDYNISCNDDFTKIISKPLNRKQVNQLLDTLNERV